MCFSPPHMRPVYPTVTWSWWWHMVTSTLQNSSKSSTRPPLQVDERYKYTPNPPQHSPSSNTPEHSKKPLWLLFPHFSLTLTKPYTTQSLSSTATARTASPFPQPSEYSDAPTSVAPVMPHHPNLSLFPLLVPTAAPYKWCIKCRCNGQQRTMPQLPPSPPLLPTTLNSTTTTPLSSPTKILKPYT